MITAKLKVKFEGDWTSQIREYDVVGLGIASTFRSRSFLGITVLDSAPDDIEDVLDTIEGNQYTESLEILETHETDEGRIQCTVSTLCEYDSYTPMQTILMEGFLPIGYAEYRDGYEYIEILAENREDVSRALEGLTYDTLEVVRIVSSFDLVPQFSLLEWQQLATTITEDERELLDLAIERGFYEIPSRMSLSELAAEAGVAKSTASRRLRNVEQAVIPLVVKYLRAYFRK